MILRCHFIIGSRFFVSVEKKEAISDYEGSFGVPCITKCPILVNVLLL